MTILTHVNNIGHVNMVDVTDKQQTVREAVSEGFIQMSTSALEAVIKQANRKGDVLATAKIAGIMAAKQCSSLIPLCHPLALTKIDVELELQPEHNRIRIQSRCKLTGKTGVEMEALTATSITALTLFDMCKAVDPAMEIFGIKVLTKSGGKTGNWTTKEENHD